MSAGAWWRSAIIRAPRWAWLPESAMHHRTRRRRSLALALLCALLATPLAARARAADLKTLEAVPVSEPIQLDGRLDDAAWQRAPAGADFVQREPDTGQPVLAAHRGAGRLHARRPSTSASTRSTTSAEPHHREGDAARRAAVARRRGRHPLRHLRRRPQRVPLRDQPERRPDRRHDHRRGTQLQPAVGRRVGRRRAATATAAGRRSWRSRSRRCASIPEGEAWGFNVLRYVRRRAEQAFWAPILLDADVKRVSLYGASPASAASSRA